MFASSAQKSSKSQSKIVEVVKLEPVVNEEKKSIFDVFKSFLAVGGDFV